MPFIKYYVEALLDQDSPNIGPLELISHYYRAVLNQLKPLQHTSSRESGDIFKMQIVAFSFDVIYALQDFLDVMDL